MRYRRLGELFIIVRELLRILYPRRAVTPLALLFANWLVWRARRRLWGERQWRAYYIDMIRFYAELYMRITERIWREARAVVPIFTVYFSRNWEYISHAYSSMEFARLHPVLKQEFIRTLVEAFKRGIPFEMLARAHPEFYSLLYMLARREIGLDWARKAEVAVLPLIFEEAAGKYGVMFFAVYLPRKLAEPDPYIGATRPPPVQHWDYAWKFELEEVPVKSPYEEFDRFAGLFDELGNVFFQVRWKPILVDTWFEEALVLGSHGLWERVGMGILRGFFGTVGKTFASYPYRRRGSYYLIRTVLHHLGLR